jgi:hypothetical protein
MMKQLKQRIEIMVEYEIIKDPKERDRLVYLLRNKKWKDIHTRTFPPSLLQGIQLFLGSAYRRLFMSEKRTFQIFLLLKRRFKNPLACY